MRPQSSTDRPSRPTHSVANCSVLLFLCSRVTMHRDKVCQRATILPYAPRCGDLRLYRTTFYSAPRVRDNFPLTHVPRFVSFSEPLFLAVSPSFIKCDSGSGPSAEPVHQGVSEYGAAVAAAATVAVLLAQRSGNGFALLAFVRGRLGERRVCPRLVLRTRGI